MCHDENGVDDERTRIAVEVVEVVETVEFIHKADKRAR
jgi:hypothetical protein